MARLIYRTRIEAPAEDVFRWHSLPGALERLTPPWVPVRIVERRGGIETGAQVSLELGRGPLRRRYVAEQRDYEAGRQFRDVQVEGPFARWDHLHRVEPSGLSACFLEDRIEYVIPGGALGRALAGAAIRRKLDRIFAYRHHVTIHDLRLHRATDGIAPRHVLVTGSGGLIGSALVPLLTTGGHRVSRLVRGRTRRRQGERPWLPERGVLDPADLEDVDAVVHLAGENIAAGRWTEARKARIRESRVAGTQLLAGALARLSRPPKVLLCASAVGFYGDRGEEQLREESPPGTGFLPEVCVAWEAATEAARKAGIRVVHLRLGVVLSSAGGALRNMLTPFRLGGGGRLGDGAQFMSWIALDDAIGAIYHALSHPSLRGAVNLVAPHPVTNRVFTRTLGRVLRRPTCLAAPAAALRLALGEMADALLLTGARVDPARLRDSGYAFRFPELEAALRHLLGRT
jgi:uncharacterized protein (TIGR01777 family)